MYINIFLSAAAAIIPMIIYLAIIWRLDIYDREPVWLVMKNYLWGAVGAVILAIIFSRLFSDFFANYISSPELQSSLDALVVAPIIEETTKGVFLLLTVSNRKFDNLTDGVVYGGAIGLGFGTTENFLYFISFSSSFEQWISVVLVRTFFSAVMHCIATSTLGVFLSFAKLKQGWFKYFLAMLGLTTAVIIHQIWNFSVSSSSTAIYGLVFIIFFGIIFSAIFAFSISGEKKIIFNQLLEEAREGLIPIEHIPILNSSGRNSKGWVDEKIRRVYIKAATTLAFRKMQLENSSGKKKSLYEQDIKLCRDYITYLLNGNKEDRNEA